LIHLYAEAVTGRKKVAAVVDLLYVVAVEVVEDLVNPLEEVASFEIGMAQGKGLVAVVDLVELNRTLYIQVRVH